MDPIKEIPTEDMILLRVGAQDLHSWQRTLAQIHNPEPALGLYETLSGARPFDQEID